MLTGKVLLAIAIVAEIVATAALKASDGLARPAFAALSFVGYIAAFSALASALRTIPLGIAYAIWSGVGILAITLLARVLFGQQLDLAAYAGIGLIVAGVLVINFLSDTADTSG